MKCVHACILLLAVGSPAFADETSNRIAAIELSESFWTKLLEFRNKPSDSMDEDDRWTQISAFGHAAFEKLITETPDLRSSIERVVAAFGKGDADADFRWFLSTEEYSTPKYGSTKNRVVQADSPRSTIQRNTQILLAEFQVRNFTQNHDLLLRFQHVLAWRRKWMDGGFNGTNRFLVESRISLADFTPECDEYWWYSRQFVVIAAATGRMDLVPSKMDQLSECHARMKALLDWIDEKGPYLRPAVNRPIWVLDKELEKSGYGYVKFFGEGERFAPLIYEANAPFPDWPKRGLRRDVAW